MTDQFGLLMSTNLNKYFFLELSDTFIFRIIFSEYFSQFSNNGTLLEIHG